ncbi:Hypothetical predicted protein [Olea europaea subsp. europaea]|uniref:Uncharacterized protein n=1 Tax=Olea europaea subsp. europaea TaxID=158383 RepID=A0A8S0Q1J1_OLEEU|nr:Hypothetical predicted protein [Olea europaea subsp. europaea]
MANNHFIDNSSASIHNSRFFDASTSLFFSLFLFIKYITDHRQHSADERRDVVRSNSLSTSLCSDDFRDDAMRGFGDDTTLWRWGLQYNMRTSGRQPVVCVDCYFEGWRPWF